MTNTISCTKLTVFTVAAVIIQITGLCLFVFGFFPVKPALSGVSGLESFYAPDCNSVHSPSHTETVLHPRELQSLYQELSGIPPLFDRLILMVIDGLPAEFVLGKDGHPPREDLMEAMPYTHSLLSNGMAIGYHAKAAPPTVTMPRLKAMVSGAIGGFLDVAFNFNTQALLDDNLLGQFLRIGWKMVMLGDETWLKLFPGFFERHDGVSSFFVKDTVQVDQNVSRHLGDELGRDDWSLLVLHYLGLDHVGHIGGRSSLLMGPKLMEMDEVVKIIHSSIMQTPDNDQGRTLLVVVSDHGMTESGNHGGSSYEETDSLALFIGLENVSCCASATDNTVHQVDIAPTLALLYGVPIPKNNVGVLISGTFDSLTDNQRLRALELNSWQLLRLVEAQLPGLSCGNFPCNSFVGGVRPETGESCDDMEKMLRCLYMNAANLHSSWKSKKESGSESGNDYSSTVAAYNEFLKTASEWLSRRVTDKPVSLLVFGIVAMALSCLMLLGLVVCLGNEAHCAEKQDLSNSSKIKHVWGLDEVFIVGVVLIIVMSMGSSSMVEEEQYIWNFVISTSFLLLLRKALQSVPGRSGSTICLKGSNQRSDFLVYFIFLVLISGRILRGWHQGGVNWTYLPDISKWLEQAGSNLIRRLFQVTSGLLMIGLGLLALFLSRSKRRIILLVGFSFLISGFLILWHIMEYQDNAVVSSSYQATILAQVIYAILSCNAIGSAVALPWVMPIGVPGTHVRVKTNSSTSFSVDIQQKSVLLDFRDSSYLIGLAYVLSWSLLELLLQQPINSMPIFLLLMQVLTSMLYYSYGGKGNKEWIEVVLLYYMGMAGHFSLGNSNTLATIDVAGAFIGLSTHSTVLSGILMFIITYASPILFLLSTVMYISIKDTSCLATTRSVDSGHFLKTMLGFPCLIPLALNSILLTAYTIVLLLMRNHLFVWSVFSPKYLYVCMTTVCIHIGVVLVAATEIYIYVVLAWRRKHQELKYAKREKNGR